MGNKRSRNSQRSVGSYRKNGPARSHTGSRPDRRHVSVGFALVGLLLVVGLGIAAVTAAAMSGSHSGSAPDGVQAFAENDHTDVSSPVAYDHVPPVGGAHNPVQLNCGVYDQQVPNENAVHSLEHGAVRITYLPNLSAADVGQLRSLVTSSYVGSERYIILSPYPGLPSPIVASAWGEQLQVQSVSDGRLGQFIHTFAGGGQGGEQGGPCTGVTGNPIE